MIKKYYYGISGDGTGITYGVYRFLNGTMILSYDRPIKVGLKTLEEASKYIADIKNGKIIDDVIEKE